MSVRSPKKGASLARPGEARRSGRRRRAPRRRRQASEIDRQLAVELVAIIAIAVLLALGIQSVPRQAVQDPERLDGADAHDRPARARQPPRDDLQRPHVGEIVVFHPPEGRRGTALRPAHYEVSPGGAPCDQTNPEESSENFIKRVVAGPGRHDLRPGRPRDRQRQTRARLLHQALRGGAGVQLPTPITIPRRSLVHDGGQPWRI